MVRNITASIQGNQNTTILANQLKAMSNQYPTLNKAEELELIKKYKNDRETLNKLLIMHNLKIVFNIAKKYKTKTDDFDGIVQDGFLGLSEAAKRFDLNRGTKFITHAYIWVKKYVLSSFYAKNIEVDKHSTSLSSPAICSKSGAKDNPELEDFVNQYVDLSCCTIKTIDDELSANEQTEICRSLMEKMNKDTSLSSTDKLVFVDFFYNHEKTRDIADKYDMSTAEVKDIKNKILGKFKNILASEYDIREYGQIG